MAEEQAIPEAVRDEALEAAKLFVYPVGWTYEPSADEERRAEKDYADRLCRAARMIEPFLLAAELRGMAAERERCIRLIDCGCERDHCGCPGNCAKDDIEAIRTEP